MSTLTTAGAASSTEKHVELHHAIQRLKEVNDDLDNLIDRVQGSSSSNPGVTASNDVYPSLQVVLECGAGAIHERVNLANEQISRLIQLLF